MPGSANTKSCCVSSSSRSSRLRICAVSVNRERSSPRRRIVFVVSFLFMIAFGLFHYFTYGGAAPVPVDEELKTAEGYSLQPLTLFLLLGAFSNGCAALTGIEAISNGVQAFKKPEAQNAATTLIWMATTADDDVSRNKCHGLLVPRASERK